MRPNTMVPDKFLNEKMILSAGEDAPEFLSALKAAGLTPTEEHNYRCYRFWRFPGFSAMWTGIGSGCVEPMMWEILQGDTPIKAIVLVGTAGLIGNNPDLCGKVYAVTRAYACSTGVCPNHLPVKPRWNNLPEHIPHRTSLSSDEYYSVQNTLQHSKYWRSGRLLEMEVTQFYFLCQRLGSPELQYLALKGVSNLDGRHETQVELSQQILRESVHTALELLTIPALSVLDARRHPQLLKAA